MDFIERTYNLIAILCGVLSLFKVLLGELIEAIGYWKGCVGC